VSAEHERAKEPLPIRPTRPHPQGFVCWLDDDGWQRLRERVREANRRSEDRPR
jgi:hypothetical protein